MNILASLASTESLATHSPVLLFPPPPVLPPLENVSASAFRLKLVLVAAAAAASPNFYPPNNDYYFSDTHLDHFPGVAAQKPEVSLAPIQT